MHYSHYSVPKTHRSQSIWTCKRLSRWEAVSGQRMCKRFVSGTKMCDVSMSRCRNRFSDPSEGKGLNKKITPLIFLSVCNTFFRHTPRIARHYHLQVMMHGILGSKSMLGVQSSLSKCSQWLPSTQTSHKISEDLRSSTVRYDRCCTCW